MQHYSPPVGAHGAADTGPSAQQATTAAPIGAAVVLEPGDSDNTDDTQQLGFDHPQCLSDDGQVGSEREDTGAERPAWRHAAGWSAASRALAGRTLLGDEFT